MQDEPRPGAIGGHPDYALFVAGVRGAQTTSPTARAQSTIANKGDDATAFNPFKTTPPHAPQDGSYRGFSEVTNGKRT